MKSTGLGKGLGALLSTNIENISEKANNSSSYSSLNDSNESEKVYKININEIEPNKNQPRKNFEEEKIDELAESIKEHGIIQPIIVVKREGFYQIIAGERRWRASKKAGIKEIPAIIRKDDEKSNKQISLIENIQRQDLNPIEEAIAIKNLMEEHGFTQEEIAKSLGKSRSSIANIVRILNLDENVKKLVEDGKLTLGHCKVLLAQPKDKQYKLALDIIKNNESVRKLEDKIKNNKIKKDKRSLSPIYQEIEDEFKNYFGTKVTLNSGKNKGKITIEYFSNEELERILELIRKN